MKTLKLTVFNGTSTFEREFAINSQLGFKKLLGTSINSIFEYNNRLKKYGATAIKANQLLSIVICVDNQPLIDSYVLNAKYGFSLKFGNSAKSKKRFASCLYDLCTWAAIDEKIVSIDELIDSLSTTDEA